MLSQQCCKCALVHICTSSGESCAGSQSGTSLRRLLLAYGTGKYLCTCRALSLWRYVGGRGRRWEGAFQGRGRGGKDGPRCGRKQGWPDILDPNPIFRVTWNSFRLLTSAQLCTASRGIVQPLVSLCPALA